MKHVLAKITARLKRLLSGSRQPESVESETSQRTFTSFLSEMPRRKRWLFLGLGAGFIGLMVPVIILGGNQVVGVLDSTAFCTTTCHDVHYAEAITLEQTPHSEVSCSDCHVGVGTVNLIRSKIMGIKDILPELTHSFELPIDTPLESRRPSSETCEACHTSSTFYGDIPEINTSYATDKLNTKTTVTHVLKVGGGLPQVASGIHWHSTAKVWYVAVDQDRQKIAWVSSENVSGTTTEYVDPNLIQQLTPAQIESNKRLMDCVDCHNRTPHSFDPPDVLIDKAITNGGIDVSLPFIKREAVDALMPQNPTLQDAYAKLGKIEDFYKNSYPEVYQEKKDSIESSIASLKQIAQLTSFGNGISWDTYPDNAKHDQPDQNLNFDWTKIGSDDTSAGCFRCHGNLVKVNGQGIEQGASVQSVIRAAASSNATIASSTLPDRGSNISSGNGTGYFQVPTSNPSTVSSNITSENRTGNLNSPTPTPRPIGPISFSSNSTATSGNITSASTSNVTATNGGGPGSGYLEADCNTCHYTYETDTAKPIAPATPHPIDGLDDCLVCHAPTGPEPFKSTHPWATNEACDSCHQSAPKLKGLEVSVKPEDAKAIPHSTENMSDCLVCHSPTGPNPIKPEHPWSTDETCAACHDQASILKPIPSPAPPTEAEIPHPTDNLEDCLTCHAPTSVKPISADHPWATNETCLACHEVSKTLPAQITQPLPQATPVTHSLPGAFSCTSCHTPSGPAPFPASHGGIPDNFCEICHRQSAPIPYSPAPLPQAPLITHQLPGSFSCTSCHNEAGPGPLPANHVGVTDEFCQICHKQAPAPPTPTPTPAPTIDAAALYSTYCSTCHGANREGGIGPALTTSSLSNLTVSQISSMTADGIGSMPGYSSQLTAEEIDWLSQWLKGDASPASSNTTNTTSSATLTPVPTSDGSQLYAGNCASCHGSTPPNSWSALTAAQLSSSISSGPGSMPAFSGTLDSTQIAAIVDFILNTPSSVATSAYTHNDD